MEKPLIPDPRQIVGELKAATARLSLTNFIDSREERLEGANPRI